MRKRFILDNHHLWDAVEDKFYGSKDRAYIHMINVLYEELQYIKNKVEQEDEK